MKQRKLQEREIETQKERERYQKVIRIELSQTDKQTDE